MHTHTERRIGRSRMRVQCTNTIPILINICCLCVPRTVDDDAQQQQQQHSQIVCHTVLASLTMSDALSERILSSTTFNLVFLMRAEIVCRYTQFYSTSTRRQAEVNDSPFCHTATHSECEKQTRILQYCSPCFLFRPSNRRVECRTVGNTSVNALLE